MEHSSGIVGATSRDSRRHRYGEKCRVTPHADGRVGVAFGGSGRRCCLLGFMGRRFGDDPNAADSDGVVLQQARRDKETTYPELVASGRCKLVVLAIETGRRWSEEAVHMVRQLSNAKAREVPSFMRFSVSLM